MNTTADPIAQMVNREANRMNTKLAMFDELVEALYQAARTFSDTERVFTIFGKPTAASAMQIAKESTLEIVARARKFQK